MQDIWDELSELDALDAPPLIQDPEAAPSDAEAPDTPPEETSSDEEDSAPEELADQTPTESPAMEDGDVDQPEEQVVSDQPVGEDATQVQSDAAVDPDEPAVDTQDVPDVTQPSESPVDQSDQSVDDPVAETTPAEDTAQIQSPEPAIEEAPQIEDVPSQVESDAEHPQPPEPPVSESDPASPEPGQDEPEAAGLVAETELPAASVAEMPTLEDDAVSMHENRVQRQMIEQQKANENLAHELADKLGPMIGDFKNDVQQTALDYMDTQILLTTLLGRVY